MRHLILAAALVAALTPFSFGEDKETYRIGVPKSAFRDVPEELVAFAGLPFQDLLKEQTGLSGEMVQKANAFEVGKEIDDGKFQFGVLQGYEYAWVKGKYPDLQPLVCSVERPKEVRALVLVRHDSKLTPSEFRNAKAAIASKLKDHGRLFVEKQRGEGSFAAIEKTPTVHDAIHKVIKGEADLTVADSASWTYFQKLYPGPSKNVKVLLVSDVFPQAVVVYKKGAIDEPVLKKMRDGFLTAHQNSKAEKLMASIRLERFEAIPAGYDEALKACLKQYPKPLEDK